MKDTAKLLAAGFITSVFVAYVNSLIDVLTGFNAFTFSIWFIIPVGAFLCGFLAASGYYFASKNLDIMPNALLLVQMILIAVFANFLIYWFDYNGAYLPGLSLSSEMSFGTYLIESTTQSHYTSQGRGLSYESGPVGGMGVIQTIVQLCGFAAGAYGIYAWLGVAPICEKCQRYMKARKLKVERFDSASDCANWMNQLFQHPLDSPEFHRLFAIKNKVQKRARGDVILTSSELRCNSCQAKWLVEEAKVLGDEEMSIIPELSRWTQLPHDTNIATPS